jgi:hypothetical protein
MTLLDTMSIQDLLAKESSEQKAECGFILHIIRTFGISKREYDLLAIIHHYTIQDYWCFLPLKKVATETGISRASLYQLLPHLINIGLLERNSYRSEILRTTRKYRDEITKK